MKPDAYVEVQRTKRVTEYQPGLEAEDSFQLGIAPDKPIGLDLETVGKREPQRAGAEVGQADISAQEGCICVTE